MKSYDLFELASRNLKEAILRNFLTTLGISVGVASLVAMVSLGAGLQELFSSKLGRSGLFDTVFVTPRDFNAQGGGRRTPAGPTTADSKKPAKVLDEPARATIAKMEHVKEVYPQIAVAGQFLFDNPLKTAKASAPAGDKKPAGTNAAGSSAAGSTTTSTTNPTTMDENLHFGNVTGLPASTQVSEAFDDLQGKFFSSPDADECIIMAEFARELLDVTETEDKASANGAKVSLRTRELAEKLPDDQLKALLGHDLIWRYAERVDSPAAGGNKKPASEAESALNGGNPMDMMNAMNGFNIVRRERKLKIVGVVIAEPGAGVR